MADTLLKSISIRNWNTVRSAELAFPEKGLILVRGLNSAAKGKMESIGSGKTSLGEAISRTLFGVRGRYTRLSDYSTHRKGDTYVKVICEHKGKPLEVELGYACPELTKDGEGFKFTYSGEEVSRDRMDNTRADLIKLLTVSPDLASWTVYLDGDKLKFNALSERKAVELLMDALMQAPWTQFHAKANNTVTSLNRDKARDALALESARRAHDEAKTEHQLAKNALAQANAEYKAQLASNSKELANVNEALKAANTALTATANRMDEIKKEIKRLTDLVAKREHDAEIAFNEARDALDNVMEQSADFLNAVTEAKFAAENAADKLADMKNRGVCPTCKQKLPAIDKAKIAAQEKLVKQLNEAVDAKTQEQAGHVANLDAAKARRTEARTAWQNISAEAPTEELSEEYERLEGERDGHNASIGELTQAKAELERGPDKSEVARCEAVLEERRKQVVKTKTAVDTAAQSLAETEETVRVAQYWQEAFGPTGIPNMILRDAIAPLNATARRISTLMTGGVIAISYATSKQLTSRKEEVAELVINVHNELGSQRFDGSSKGESGLSELIVAETMAEVGGIAQRIGYRWYDEVCPNQDEVVRRSIYAYLSEIAQRYGILVFLVSHSPEAANYADFTLLAEKTPQGTVYSWA